MGRKKLSMAEKVRRYVAANPHAKPRDVAAKLGVPVSTVYVAKHGMKKGGANTITVSAIAPTLTIAPAPAIEMIEPEPDAVNHPPHYTSGGIETIDFIEAKLTKEEFVGYLKGNAIKYASRIGKKGDAEVDAGKMAWYAMKLRDKLSLTA